MIASVGLGPHGDLELRVDQGSVEDLVRELRDASPALRVRRRGSRVRVPISDGPLLAESRIARLRWDRSAEQSVANRQEVSSNHASVMATVRGLRTAPIGWLREQLLPSLDWHDELDDHQVRNVSIMTVAGGWGACIFDEQGTGKTPTALAAFDVLVDRDEADVLVVVAPKSMVAEWAEEVNTFMGGRYRAEVLLGTPAEKAGRLRSGAEVVVTNYETIVSLQDPLKLFCASARVVLAVDESFNVKNPSAARTAAVRDLREACGRTYVLCGTPAPNAAVDVVAQVDLVDHGHAFAGRSINPDDTAAVRSTLESRVVYTRNLKRVVLPDLPGRQFTKALVELAPEQHRAYLAGVDDLILDLREVSDSEYQRKIASYLERRSALIRICSHPGPLIPGYDEVPAKQRALDELLPRLLEDPTNKVVLWSFYRHSLSSLVDRYSTHGVVHIDGSVSIEDRRSAVAAFQSDGGPRIFVGNPAAAGAGITLHRANVAVYESMSNQAAHYLQSLDRIHRRGQEREVEYVSLLARDTIEEVEYARLHSKAQAQADLLGDPADPVPSRSVFLSELIDLRDRMDERASWEDRPKNTSDR